MERVPKQNHQGVIALKLSSTIINLIQKADNLQVTDGAVTPGQLKLQRHPQVTVSELQWTDQKTKAMEEFMKELKEFLGWEQTIDWLTKDLVLERSALSLPPGTSCVIIPQNYPGESTIIFHREKELLGSPKWNVTAAYVLDPGVSIRVKGTIRFYAITFNTPPGQSSGV